MTAAAPQRTSMHIASKGKKYTFFLVNRYPYLLARRTVRCCVYCISSEIAPQLAETNIKLESFRKF